MIILDIVLQPLLRAKGVSVGGPVEQRVWLDSPNSTTRGSSNPPWPQLPIHKDGNNNVTLIGLLLGFNGKAVELSSTGPGIH